MTLDAETAVACREAFARIYPSSSNNLGAPLDGHRYNWVLNHVLKAVCGAIMELPAGYIHPETGAAFAHCWPIAFDARKETLEERDMRVAPLNLMKQLDTPTD